MLEFASPRLQNDKEFVKKCISHNPIAYVFASTRLQHNKEMILFALNTALAIDVKAGKASEMLYYFTAERVIKSINYNLRSHVGGEWVKKDPDIVLALCFPDGNFMDGTDIDHLSLKDNENFMAKLKERSLDAYEEFINELNELF